MDKKKVIGGIGVAAVLLLVIVLMVVLKSCGSDTENRDGSAAVSEIATDERTGGESGSDEPGEIPTNEAGNQLIDAVDEEGKPVVIEIDPDGNIVSVETREETVGTDSDGNPVSGSNGSGGKDTTIYTGPTNPVPEVLEDGDIRVTNSAGEFIKDVDPDELVEPGKDTLEEEKIKNYEAIDGLIEEGNTTIVDGQLEIHSAGVYTGVYIEGGEDIYLDNVVALLVTNTTEDMLQVLRFTMTPKDAPEEEMLFQVTDLPAGATALIFELGKRPYAEGETYVFDQELHTFYNPEVVAGSDQFSVELEDGVMKLTNLTDKTFDRVYVHYKYMQEGGSYFGGIAYRSGFESVGPNETVSTGAGHYTEKVSQIVLIEGTERE